MSRMPWVFAAVALLLGGCAPRRGGDTVRVPHPPPRNNPPDCACTLEHRRNLCITVNGAESLPDTFAYVRQREDGTADLLELPLRCFGEWRGGLQRIILLRNGTAVDSTGWFETPTTDCCHAEAKTVDFRP